MWWCKLVKSSWSALEQRTKTISSQRTLKAVVAVVASWGGGGGDGKNGI